MVDITQFTIYLPLLALEEMLNFLKLILSFPVGGNLSFGAV